MCPVLSEREATDDENRLRLANTDLLLADHVSDVLDVLMRWRKTAVSQNNTHLVEVLSMAIECCHFYKLTHDQLILKKEAFDDSAVQLIALQKQLQSLLLAIDPAYQAVASQNELASRSVSGRIGRWLKQLTAFDGGDEAEEMETAVFALDIPINVTLVEKPHKATTSPLEQMHKDNADLHIYCLGTFRIYHHNKLYTEINGIKVQLLKYLIMHKDKSISKDVLKETFWPGADLDATRRNLHQVIYQLRQALRQHQPDKKHILFEDDHYILNPDLNIWVDCDAFINYAENGYLLEQRGDLSAAIEQLSIAESLYQGQFLEDTLYEDWTNQRRQALSDHYQLITKKLINYYAQEKTYTPIVALCQKRLTYDCCDEFAHYQLMACYMKQGQRHMAVRQYQLCADALDEELGLLPSEALQAFYLEIIR